MTTKDEFNSLECEKIDALDVDAYIDGRIDGGKITIVTPWGEATFNIEPIIAAFETVTHVKLVEGEDTGYIDYENENGEHECIDGAELARFIPLKQLRDMADGNDWRTGYAPVWDETAGKFVARYVNTEGSMDSRVTALENKVTVLQTTLQSTQESLNTALSTINSLRTRVDALETLTAKPEGIDPDATLTWGNVNVYTNTDQSTGAYTHDPATSVTGDRIINSDVS